MLCGTAANKTPGRFENFVLPVAVVDKKISGRRRACRILSKEEELITFVGFLAGFRRFDNLKGRNYEKTFVLFFTF